MKWDLTVDFVFVGAGAGALVSAILAADAGASTFVANFTGTVGRTPRYAPTNGWPSEQGLARTLNIDTGDWETDQLLAALTEDLDHVAPTPLDMGVPIRHVDDFAPATTENSRGRSSRKRDPVPPFYGARLRDWGAACIASPYGVVYSRTDIGPTTSRPTRNGSIVEVNTAGTLHLDPKDPGPSLDHWLFTEAKDRRIHVRERTRLQRLVFDDDGQVTGAVFDTPTASYAVQARHGLVLAPDRARTNTAAHVAPPLHQPVTAQVCTVREPLSRFFRMELHVSEPVIQSRSRVSAR